MSAHKDKTIIVLVWVTLLVLILVGGGISALVLNNRFRTDRENKLAEQKAQQQQEEEQKKKDQQFQDSISLIGCKADADKDYWSYIELNSTHQRPGENGQTIYTAPQQVWDTADSRKQQAYNDCYRQYPSN